jgi:hypothetical protein
MYCKKLFGSLRYPSTSTILYEFSVKMYFYKKEVNLLVAKIVTPSDP